MSVAQERYIVKKLPSLLQLEEIKVENSFEEILQHKYNDGTAMQQILNIIQTQKKVHEGYYSLEKTELTKLRKIGAKSVESNIYESKLFSKTVSIILKVPKTTEYHNELIRTYFIGMHMNKLRLLIPNFVYTFGLFRDDENHIFMGTEYIDGPSFEQLLKENRLGIIEIFNIIVQIFLALEIAQRHYRFCHYDLHVNNIMLRPIKEPYTYVVVLDDKKYTIKAEKYIPIIIDYGLSSIHLEKRSIGTYSFQKYGIFPFLIQGVDQYKLLFHTYARAIPQIQRQIGILFLLYGEQDPYKILINPVEMLLVISKQYLRNVSFSSIATCTPLDFVIWMSKQEEIKLQLVIENRDLFFPGSDMIKKKLRINSSPLTSYVMLKYMEKFSTEKISDKDQTKSIKNDRKMLEKYKTISVPNLLKAESLIQSIFSYKLGDKPCKISLSRLSQFIKKTAPYLQFLYTIKELKVENIYEKFIIEFENSTQYKIYIKINALFDKAERWKKTLHDHDLFVE